MAIVITFAENLIMPNDLFEGVDYYQLDDLLTTEHKLIRDTVRQFVKQEISPIIEEYAQKSKTPKHLINGLAEIGGFVHTIPVQYGGGGLDNYSYGVIIQEIERGASRKSTLGRV